VSKRLLPVLMMLFIPALGLATDDLQNLNKTLTLEQAVALALENNRSIRNAELEVSKQEDSLAIARTHRLPNFDTTVFGSMLLSKVDFTFKKGDFGTFPSGEPNPSSDVSITTPRKFNTFALISANQPLSQLYRVNLNIQSAKVNSQVAGEDLRARTAHGADCRTVTMSSGIKERQDTAGECHGAVEVVLAYIDHPRRQLSEKSRMVFYQITSRNHEGKSNKIFRKEFSPRMLVVPYHF